MWFLNQFDEKSQNMFWNEIGDPKNYGKPYHEIIDKTISKNYYCEDTTERVKLGLKYIREIHAQNPESQIAVVGHS